MSKTHIEAVVDTREPPEVPVAVAEHPEVSNVDRAQLSAGDIGIGAVGFERKTVDDYASSVLEDRFDDQLTKLADAFDHAYILLEGDMVETEQLWQSSIRGESLRGHMASVTARENGVRAVIPSSSTEMLVDVAVRLGRKHVEDPSRTYVPSPDIDASDAPVPVQMYACIPGVGPATARQLYDEFGSIASFVDEATHERLTEVDGIGATRATDILSVIV